MMILTAAAFAKVNLTLDVLGKRPDGYHDLCSVMQTISLHDDITLALNTGEDWKILCDDDAVPCDARNLAWKAARTFFDATAWEPDGVTVRLTKRIPSQAGLGGGSADAAAVLRMLNKWRAEPLSEQELCDLGAKVGSDVPFCVLGGTALVQGRGERLTRLPDAPQMFLAVCKPEQAFSTPELFRRLDAAAITKRPDTEAMLRALHRADKVGIGAGMCNVFEQAVYTELPQLAQIKQTMQDCGALGAQMTGSGSAVFGLFAAEADAQAACSRLSCGKVFCAKTV